MSSRKFSEARFLSPPRPTSAAAELANDTGDASDPANPRHVKRHANVYDAVAG